MSEKFDNTCNQSWADASECHAYNSGICMNGIKCDGTPNYPPAPANTYAPEQIDEAKVYFTMQANLVKRDKHTPVPPYGLILLSALSTAEKNNADWQEYNAELLARAERAEAYAAKLEKAGDAMRFGKRCCAEAWDAARKEKP